MTFKLPIKYFFLLVACLFISSTFAQNSNFKVTLDAGHGGKDPGSGTKLSKEKNVTLAVVLKVGKILDDVQGIKVNYTRKTDVFIDLVERANIANRADASIFVSIHCNSNPSSAADGTETYVMGMSKNASNLAVAKRENSVITMEKEYKKKYDGYDPNSPESIIGITMEQELYMQNSIALAGKVQSMFKKQLSKKSRGVKQAPYMVLHKASMPRVLIEIGFISNKKDRADLISERGQNDIAEAIAKAIISYKKEYYGSGETAEKETPKAKTEKETVSKTGVVFKVQISASSKKIETKSSNFKGLKPVSRSKASGSLYIYTFGETADYKTANENLSKAKAKGFKSAYLIAFSNGKKITIPEAIK